MHPFWSVDFVPFITSFYDLLTNRVDIYCPTCEAIGVDTVRGVLLVVRVAASEQLTSRPETFCNHLHAENAVRARINSIE